MLAEGRLYDLGPSGRTFALTAKPAFELMATNDLESRGLFNSNPALTGGVSTIDLHMCVAQSVGGRGDSAASHVHTCVDAR